MIVRAESSVEVQLYYARAEIGGFMPPKIREELTNMNWLIVGDVYQRKYAGAIATFDRSDYVNAAVGICRALELLGAPQKKDWTLEPDYKYVF